METGNTSPPLADGNGRGAAGRAATGVPGLDDVLNGGFPRNRVYLIQGDPGTGKTTLALQFLLDGAARGEKGTYVTLSETRDELLDVAHSHGWSLEGIDLQELSATQQMLQARAQQTVFEPAEVELSETTRTLLDEVGRTKPSRVVLDSLSELRLLGGGSLRFRQQILAIKQYFAQRDCTVLLLDDLTVMADDRQLQSLAHGVVQLEQIAPEFGTDRRRLRVVKMRGMTYRQGYHDYAIDTGGLRVFPRLVAAEHRHEEESGPISSDIDELDSLLGGGPREGTAMLVVGPAGAGKSTLTLQYALAAARRGQNAAIYLFDERPATYLVRAKGMSMDPAPYLEDGRITIRQIDPAEMSPGEFTQLVRDDVADASARLIVIDSLDGLLLSMPGEKMLAMQIHELLAYLGQNSVTTILTMSQHGMATATVAETQANISYVADTAVLLRYYEHAGEMHRAIWCVKTRSGPHEHTIRDLRMTAQGLRLGEPLREFTGVMTGMSAPMTNRPPGGDADRSNATQPHETTNED